MQYKCAIPAEHDKPTMGRKSHDTQNLIGHSISGRKCNRCVIFPANVSMVAEALERRNQDWIIRTKVTSDLIIQVGHSTFYLHKLPMVSRSMYLNRLVFDRRSNGKTDLQLDNLPGGTETFESVVKFCYGWKVDLTVANIAPLYSAAHFLEMTDDLEQGNLISKTEAFLSFLILTSWKDTFQIFKSCEPISYWAKELGIVKRCSEAIALNVQANNVENSVLEDRHEKWWFEDVSALRIDHFIEVIQSIKSKAVRSELVGSCIAHWTAKRLSRITFGLHSLNPKHMTHQLQKVTTECLIKLLPVEENSVSFNFLLHLLKVALMVKINSELLNMLERRISFMLEQCRVPDLLVKNYGDDDSACDVGIVIRVVESYVSFAASKPTPKLFVVGRLVDDYLALVSRDEKLSAKRFQSLVEALPKDARFCDDNLYTAIDMYLKAHPSLIEEERVSVCKTLDYHRLSQEAREHVMKNDRLPAKIMTRFILLEQVNMTRSMTASGSNYRRTKIQAILKVSKRGWMNSRKEIKIMKKELDKMKVQLNELQMCKLKLQGQK
ncbi:root phototropism protein 3-like [Corylus avellana]|uniref:root phototropism protein 3-like n=1 Tax=Corylus avellana TaxID=13451 RepID=UPI002869EFF0|nr:root phototropism protein 3-like [Corylus avellana]